MIATDNIDKDFLLALLRVGGVSSDEHRPSMLVRNYLSPYVDTMVKDMMGNTLASAHPEGNYQILLSAHIDEIGMQVTEYCENGLLKLRKVGGVNTLHIIGQEVYVYTSQGYLQGVIVTQGTGNNNTIPDIDDCYVEIYRQNKEEVKHLVEIGAYVTFSPNSRIIEDTLISKSIDNRTGVFVISQVFKQLAGKLNHVNLSVGATTQEEIGLRGMAVLARNTNPAICLNVDVTDACQINKKQLPLMGNGGVLYQNADSNPKLRQMLKTCAHAANIPLQIATGRSITGGTDSSRIQLFSPRTAVADISIPCKYMHTHHEQCSLTDISSCIRLLEAFILHLDADYPNVPPDLSF